MYPGTSFDAITGLPSIVMGEPVAGTSGLQGLIAQLPQDDMTDQIITQSPPPKRRRGRPRAARGRRSNRLDGRRFREADRRRHKASNSNSKQDPVKFKVDDQQCQYCHTMHYAGESTGTGEERNSQTCCENGHFHYPEVVEFKIESFDEDVQLKNQPADNLHVKQEYEYEDFAEEDPLLNTDISNAIKTETEDESDVGCDNGRTVTTDLYRIKSF